MNRNDWAPSVGAYAMHHMGGGGEGTIVLINEETSPGRFGISYVQVLPSGEVIGGGHSYSWPAAEFRPLSTAKAIAASRAHEARRTANDFENKAKLHHQNARTWEAAVKAIVDAESSLKRDDLYPGFSGDLELYAIALDAIIDAAMKETK